MVDYVIFSALALGLLLLAGHLLRHHAKVFQTLHMPASLVAGMLGMAVLQGIKAFDSDLHTDVITNYLVGWEALPSKLTTVIFAGLVIGKPVSSPQVVWQKAGAHLLYGLSVVFGQFFVCALATGALLVPAFGTNPLFAPVVPLGLEGGHGVVAGIKGVFQNLGYYPEGHDVGMAAASIGIVFGVMFGAMCVNWAAARGLLEGMLEEVKQSDHGIHENRASAIQSVAPSVQASPGNPRRSLVAMEVEDSGAMVRPVALSGRVSFKGSSVAAGQMAAAFAASGGLQKQRPRLSVFELDQQPSAGQQVVAPESLDSFSYHLCLLSVALGIGVGMKESLALTPGVFGTTVANFPLFPFCLIASLISQTMVFPCLGLGTDAATMERILNTLQDFMITAAMAFLNFDELVAQGVPFTVTVVLSMVWSAAAFFIVAPMCLPDYWPERALIELGVSLGSTATGLLLLRMADPDNRTPVLEQFGFKQVIHASIVGGGVFDALSLQMANRSVWFLTGLSGAGFVLCCAALVAKKSCDNANVLS